MNSKGVEPRVGMQYDWMGQSKKIHAICGNAIDCIVNGELVENSGDVGTWHAYPREIEWIPPTDEEREMFLEAARHHHSPWDTRCLPFCEWSTNGEGSYIPLRECADIAESLAMDGL